MITKKSLLALICDLDEDVTALSLKVNKLEKALNTKKTVAQPRDKSGKFAKKK